MTSTTCALRAFVSLAFLVTMYPTYYTLSFFYFLRLFLHSIFFLLFLLSLMSHRGSMLDCLSVCLFACLLFVYLFGQIVRILFSLSHESTK